MAYLAAYPLHRYPQLIELWLDGVANSGTEAVAWELIPVLDLPPRGWVRTRDGVWSRFPTSEVDYKQMEESEAGLS